MKALLALATLVLSTNAFAAALPKTLECDNGILDDDRLQAVKITKKTVEFQMWETFVTAKRADVQTNGNTLAIVEKTLPASAEGDESKVKTSALLVYVPAEKALIATLVLDGNHAVMSAVKMKCK